MSRPAEDLFPAGYQFLTDAGAVLNAGYLYIYVNDQAYSTQQTVYQDAAKGTSWTQPITLGSDGRLSAPVKADTRVDIRIYDSLDNLIETHNNAGTSWSAVGTDLNANLLSNWSFETAGSGGEAFANWTETDADGYISRYTTDQYHGAAAARFAGSFSGGHYIDSDAFEVTPGKKIDLSFFVKCDDALAEPAIAIYWLTSAQAAVSNEYLYQEDFGAAPTSWTLRDGFTATPPATARYAQLRVIGNESGTPYVTMFDQISVVERRPLIGGTVTQVPIGLELSIDAGDTSHDINVTAGSVLDSTLAEEIILPAEMTKQIDASWAQGDDSGGLFAGSTATANGRLGVYVIKNTTSGQVDLGFDDDASLTPTLPTGFDVFRYLGTCTLDATANIENALWYGPRYIKLAAPDAEVDNSSLSASASPTLTTATMNAPPGADVYYGARVELPSAGSELMIQIRATDSDWVDGVGSAAAKFAQGLESTDIQDELWVKNEERVSESSQLDYGAIIGGNPGPATFQLYIYGWIDNKRNNP